MSQQDVSPSKTRKSRRSKNSSSVSSRSHRDRSGSSERRSAPIDPDRKEVRLALIRHSNSCANSLREASKAKRTDISEAARSNSDLKLRDPPLSYKGMAEVQTCRGAVLQFLRDRGIDVSGALKGASPLYRARQTATLLFGNDVVHTFATLGELGDVPENTPRSSKRHRDPSWDAFLGEVAQLASDARRPRSDFVVVAHGSFLGAHLTELTGTKMKFDNLDAHVLRFRFRSSPSPQLRFLSALHDPEADHLRVAKECRDRASEMAIAMRADDKNRVAAGDCPENFMVRTAR